MGNDIGRSNATAWARGGGKSVALAWHMAEACALVTDSVTEANAKGSIIRRVECSPRGITNEVRHALGLPQYQRLELFYYIPPGGQWVMHTEAYKHLVDLGIVEGWYTPVK